MPVFMQHVSSHPNSCSQIFLSCIWSFYYQSFISFCSTSSLNRPKAVSSFSQVILSQRSQNGQQIEGKSDISTAIPTVFSFYSHREWPASGHPSSPGLLSCPLTENCPNSQIAFSYSLSYTGSIFISIKVRPGVILHEKNCLTTERSTWTLSCWTLS